MMKSLNVTILGTFLLVGCGTETELEDESTANLENEPIVNSVSALTAKSCSIDSSHWATVEAEMSNNVMIGYYVTYHVNGGWAVGNHCNEHVSHNGFHFWDSPDSGSPNIRIHRNMPDVALPNCVQVVFDRSGGDSKCTECF